MEASAGPQVHVVEPPRGWEFPSLGEVWQHRDLVYFLIRRDVAIRYRQTLIGATWAILQPVLLAIVFSVFLGSYARVPAGAHVPYPVFAVSGMVMWLYFTGAISLSSESTVASAQLISKVYFPRIIIPVAGVVLPLTDLALGLVVVIGVTLAYGVVPPVQVVLLPLLALLTLMTALGVGLWFSALNVKYRDIRLLVPFLIQVGLFVTPIVYPFSLVPHSLRPFYALNPMVGVLEAYRWMLFPRAAWPGAIILIPLGASLLLLVTGALYYRHAERDFADVV